MPNLWINAGELSGDMHGGALLRALKDCDRNVTAVGMGGPNLAAAGMQNLLRIESLSVMGVTEIITALPRALRLLRTIKHELIGRKEAGQIDAVILIDAPDFNFRVARIANTLDIPVYYYIPPKIWAWRTRRVRFLAKHIRRMFCILPFEKAFYQEHGLEDRADFIGNPLVDLVKYSELEKIRPVPHLLGIMPGSRRSEVRQLMPIFGDTARRLLARHPELEFQCLRAPNIREDDLRALWPANVPLKFVEPEQRYMAMRSCNCILAASGTATLETALAGTPTIIAYKISPISFLIGKWLINVKWVGLPNLILGQEIFPECLQDKAHPEHLAYVLRNWLEHPEIPDSIRNELWKIRELCGQPGGTQRAAAHLLEDLQQYREQKLAREQTTPSGDGSGASE